MVDVLLTQTKTTCDFKKAMYSLTIRPQSLMGDLEALLAGLLSASLQTSTSHVIRQNLKMCMTHDMSCFTSCDADGGQVWLTSQMYSHLDKHAYWVGLRC